MAEGQAPLPFWTAWSQQVGSARDNAQNRCSAGQMRSAVVRQVKTWVAAGICPREAPAWVTKATPKPRRSGTRGRRSMVRWSENTGGRVGNHPALRLHGLLHIEDGALLTLSVTLNGDQVAAYSVGVRGRNRRTGRGWYLRVDLDDGQRGRGPCTHPLLHAHRGEDPDLEPNVRVPMPYLPPERALQWLVAVVHSDRLEPEPWDGHG